MAKRSQIVFVVLIISALASYSCTQLTPEMQVIHDAADGLGGVDNVIEAPNLVLEGSGRQYRLGQNHDPDDDLPHWDVDEYKREVDLQNGRWRVTQTRTPTFLSARPIVPQDQVFGLDGDVAYSVGGDGTARRLAERLARDRIADHYHHPIPLLQLALSEGSTVGNLQQEGGQDVLDITSATGETYTMHVDSETKLPSKIVSAGYNPNLGDVTLTTTFETYQETGGLGGFSARFTLPREISSMMDDWPTWALRVSSNIGGDIEDLSASEDARSAPAPEFQANVQVEEIATGVWHLGGQSHHSVLIEFDEYLLLVEAPHSDARTLAVIAKARELQPEKPLQYVVNTHHHFDHSGGIRAAVSEGLTIITHEINAPFYEEIVARSHTIEQDALARNPQELMVETVTGDQVYELSSGRRTLQIVRIFQDKHSESILMIYLPRERILIEVDAFTPTAQASPFATNLLKNINDLKWRVNTIVPLHGGITDLDTLEETVEGLAG